MTNSFNFLKIFFSFIVNQVLTIGILNLAIFNKKIIEYSPFMNSNKETLN